MTGGTTVPPRALDAWIERAVTVIQGYGLTESGGNVTYLPIDHSPGKRTSAGVPMPRSGVRVVDASGRSLPANERGEIMVRSPSTMLEYWCNPAATAESMLGGWLRAGDLGYFDTDGYLYVVDRIKELVIVGASNVSPADLEAVLTASPDVAAAAVVGRPDDRLGEVPVAFVVRRPGSRLTVQQAHALFDARIAAYKRPHNIIFLDAMPLTSVGKPERTVLRALATAGA